jgi:hypothetical protein
VLLGQDEAMAVIRRIVVHKRERIVVLKKLEAGDLSDGDLAEDAFSIRFHSFLPRFNYRYI